VVFEYITARIPGGNSRVNAMAAYAAMALLNHLGSPTFWVEVSFSSLVLLVMLS
jgi:hypothetical protein